MYLRKTLHPRVVVYVPSSKRSREGSLASLHRWPAPMAEYGRWLVKITQPAFQWGHPETLGIAGERNMRCRELEMMFRRKKQEMPQRPLTLSLSLYIYIYMSLHC